MTTRIAKRTLCLLLAICLSLGALPGVVLPVAAAAGDVSGPGYEFKADTKTLTITDDGGVNEWWMGGIPQDEIVNLVIKKGVTKIERIAFWCCTSLQSITLPEGVVAIGDSAFAGCKSLQSITLPASVTSIGEAVFEGCSALETINVTAGNKAYLSENGVLYNTGKTRLVWYPAKKASTSLVIPQSVTTITNHAFGDWAGLRDVKLPSGVTTIPYSAFYNCTSLTHVSAPGATKIGDLAFVDCKSLQELRLPATPPALEGGSGIWFASVPTTCKLVPVDREGTPLTGDALASALAAYDKAPWNSLFTLQERPKVGVDPASLSFGGVTVETTVTLPLKVSAADLIDPAGYAVSGTDAAAFSVTLDSGYSAATGGTLSVAFRPTEARAYSADLKLTSPGAAVTVPLTGTGVLDSGNNNNNNNNTRYTGSWEGGTYDDRTDYEKLVDQLEKEIGWAAPGARFSLNMRGTPILPGKILNAMAGKDLTLTLELGYGVEWVLQGKDVPAGTYADRNFGADPEAKTLPVAVTDTVAGEGKVLQLALRHQGPYGFAMTLVLETSRENAGLYANLYAYNPKVKKLEYQASGLIGEDGKAALPLDTGVDYVVSITKNAPKQKPVA